MVQTFSTQPANTIETNFINRTYSRSGMVTKDTYYGETATALWVGDDGDVVLEAVDGTYHFFQSVPVGKLEFKHTRVMTTATVGGGVRTTTADKMTWMGGGN